MNIYWELYKTYGPFKHFGCDDTIALFLIFLTLVLFVIGMMKQ